MVDMRRVYSSHVDKIGHDPALNELHVEYSDGKKSVYAGVDADKAKLVMGSESIGKALHQHVKSVGHGHSYK